MEDLLIYGGATACFALGFLSGRRSAAPDAKYYKTLYGVYRERDEDSFSKFVDAAKECNALEDELANANASIARLTDALAAKNARLERIAEAFQNQQSGTAQKVVRMARGDA